MMLGIYLGQFCINTLTYFFITWFPVYLVQQRGTSILNAGSSPRCLPSRLCGRSLRRDLVGFHSAKRLLAHGGAQDAIVAGMLLSMSIMALSFFGEGIGALGWAIVSDTAPREIAGLSGGLFNMLGNSPRSPRPS
jgi:MFS transporter, ACS family, glucarate transporter